MDKTLSKSPRNIALVERVKQPIARSISNAMISSTKLKQPLTCKKAWEACARLGSNTQECQKTHDICIENATQSVRLGSQMLDKLVAREMFGRLPSEGEMKLDTASVRIRATKVRTSDLKGSLNFSDADGTIFQLPSEVANFRECNAHNTECGINVVVQTWNKEVRGQEIIDPAISVVNSTNFSGVLLSSVTSLTVHSDNEAASKISVKNLTDSDTSAVMISLVHELPSKAVLEPPPEGFQYNSECVYYNPEKEVFSSDGCTTLNSFNNSMLQCRCTHLTGFAVWLQLVKESEPCNANNRNPARAKGFVPCAQKSIITSDVERYIQLFLALSNFGLAVIALTKMLRFIVPDIIQEKTVKEMLGAMTIADYQCVLVLITTLINGSVALARYLKVVNSSSLSLSAFLLTLPMLVGFWAASFTVFNWAGIIHKKVTNKHSRVPLAGFLPHYFCFNLMIVTAVLVCWGVLVGVSSREQQQTWAKIGQTTVAMPALLLATAALVYGIKLTHKISVTLKNLGTSKTAEEKRPQIVACYKIGAVMIIFALMFLCQATIDLIAGWFPKWYFEDLKLRINGKETYALSPMNLVHSCCSLCTSTIIIFVVVKIDEFKIVVYDFATPIANLGKRISRRFRGQSEANVLEAEEKLIKNQEALKSALGAKPTMPVSSGIYPGSQASFNKMEINKEGADSRGIA